MMRSGEDAIWITFSLFLFSFSLQLSGLDLSSNKLLSLSHLRDMVKAAPGLTYLNLSRNHLRHINELEKVKGWCGLMELMLEGNELCNQYKNKSQTEYTRWYFYHYFDGWWVEFGQTTDGDFDFDCHSTTFIWSGSSDGIWGYVLLSHLNLVFGGKISVFSTEYS